MYKNKSRSGANNISGRNIAFFRKQLVPPVSQRAFAEKLQLMGLDLDKNAIQRIECGKRFVTDIELKYFARLLEVSVDQLLTEDKNSTPEGL